MAQRGNNPFDLSDGKGRAGPGRTFQSTTYSSEEQADKLENYITIPQTLWELVHYGTHVRYVTKAGEFRVGGFVARNPFDTIPKGASEKKRFIKLQNGFNSRANGYAEWIVAYEDIESLYAKPDAVAMTVQQNVEVALQCLNENVKQLATYVKALQARIKVLEQGRQ